VYFNRWAAGRLLGEDWMQGSVEHRESVWVFGYGSLIWRQDFPYEEARRAHVRGWERRFWQGSHDHRGIQSDPGRVVTLVEAKGERCFGSAFKIDASVFDHLDQREINGYRRVDVEIFFDSGSVLGVTYHAPIGNFAFLGDAPIDDMVVQIKRCAGRSGRNTDYVLELARALRKLSVEDAHVFELEAMVEQQGFQDQH
jgi:glutathione-specific gamma-glutamylcyclotransferase